MRNTALWLTAFAGITAIGVDVARIAFTANEVQTAAEVAATAGAQLVSGVSLCLLSPIRDVRAPVRR